jgi:hypothetical protein
VSYVKKERVPVREGESAVELDSGELVAVVCNRTVTGGRVQFAGSVRAITEDGESVLGIDGRPVERSFMYSDPRPGMADQVARDVLLALLGESPELITWSEQALQDVSIRQALALANINPGAFDASAVL